MKRKNKKIKRSIDERNARVEASREVYQMMDLVFRARGMVGKPPQWFYSPVRDWQFPVLTVR